MKKLFSLLLTAALCVGAFTGCGDSAASSEAANSAAAASVQTSQNDDAASDAADPAAEAADTAAVTYPVEIENELGVTVLEEEPCAIAVFDVAMLDILDTLGYGDRVVAVTHGQAFPDYLAQYDSDLYVNLGGFKDWDEEALSNSNPDLIFAGFRQTKSIETVTAVAPTIYVAEKVDGSDSAVDALAYRVDVITSLYGGAENAETYLNEIREKVAKIQAYTAEHEVDFVIVTAENGALSLGGNRADLLVNDLGMTSLNEDSETIGKGGEAAEGQGGNAGESLEGGRSEDAGESLEGGRSEDAGESLEGGHGGIGSDLEGGSGAGESGERGGEALSEEDMAAQTAETVASLVELNPTYVFVFDKDASEREEGMTSAEDIVAAADMSALEAYQNGNVICVDNAIWSTASGGLRGMSQQLDTLMELFGLS